MIVNTLTSNTYLSSQLSTNTIANSSTNTDNPFLTTFFKNTFVFNRLEVELVPFTYCNLACDFCETRFNRIKPNLQWFDIAYNAISNKLQQTNDVSYLTYEMWGGELFDDKVFNKQLFDQYKLLHSKLASLALQHNCQYEFVIHSNCIHHNIDYMIEWVNETGSRLGSSYDFAGRFAKQHQLQLWLDNMDKLIGAGIKIDLSIVAHKKNVDIVYGRQGIMYDLFVQLYNSGNYNIDFEYYNDVYKLDQYYVSDKEIGEFLKYMLKQFPAISEVYNLTKTHLGNTKNVFAEGLPRHFMKVWPNSIEYDSLNNIDKFKRLVHSKRCFECQYKSRCSPRYDLEFDDTQYCINRAVFEFIDASETD